MFMQVAAVPESCIKQVGRRLVSKLSALEPSAVFASAGTADSAGDDIFDLHTE